MVAKVIVESDNKAKLFDEASRVYNINNVFSQRHASLVQLLPGGGTMVLTHVEEVAAKNLIFSNGELSSSFSLFSI